MYVNRVINLLPPKLALDCTLYRYSVFSVRTLLSSIDPYCQYLGLIFSNTCGCRDWIWNNNCYCKHSGFLQFGFYGCVRELTKRHRWPVTFFLTNITRGFGYYTCVNFQRLTTVLHVFPLCLVRHLNHYREGSAGRIPSLEFWKSVLLKASIIYFSDSLP